jgi:hypothetical protein
MIRWKKGIKFKTYEPETKLQIDKHEAFSWFHIIGSHFAAMGGGISLFFSGILMTIRAFFSAKGKLREMQMASEKVIHFRIKKHH